MMKSLIFPMVGAATIAVAAALASTSLANAASVKTGYADVDGLHMYYEIHGKGQPTVLLHGAYMSTESMKPLTDALAKTRKVIVVDFQGHGRTADIDRPITYEGLADDVAALMTSIGVKQADVFGYSLGGGVAYQVAIRHPDQVRKLAVASATFNSDGMYPQMIAMMGQIKPETFAGTPFEAEYKRQAPRPQDFPTLVKKLTALDTTKQEWPADDIKAIKATTLVISGDADVVRPEHSLEIFRLRGGGPSQDFMSAPQTELAILPRTTHLDVLTTRVALVAGFLTDFFDRKDK